MNIKELKKIRPLFTKIVTTAEKFEEDSKVGAIVDTNKLAGTIKPYQKVVAIGANSAGIKEGSLKDGVVKENPTVEYRFPIITLESGDHLLIDTMDIDFVIEDFIEESLNERAAKAGIYTPNNTIIS